MRKIKRLVARLLGKEDLTGSQIDSTSQPSMPQFPTMPRVLLIDVNKDADLSNLGVQISRGSFGTPFKVEMDDLLSKVPVSHDLPGDLMEHDVVFVDLSPSRIHPRLIGEYSSPAGETDWWAAHKSGLLDPRAKSAHHFCEQFENMLSHGAVFIVFAAPPIRQEVTLGRISQIGLSQTVLGQSLPNPSVWGFLRVLQDLNITEEQGTLFEIHGSHTATIWLKSQFEGASFKCTFEYQPGRQFAPIPSRVLQKSIPTMETLARNRRGSCVAGVFEWPQHKGKVLVLPQYADIGVTIESLLMDFLPKIRPDLFGIEEGPQWLRDVAYASPEALAVGQEISDVEAKYNRRLEELTQTQEARMREYDFMHKLLSATGDELVRAVQTALIELGFSKVEVVDDSMADNQPMEDLRISDASPILLIEVKGVEGRPRDEDVLQAQKYVAPRMKEWNRTDVQALSIVNYERQTPPVNRTPEPFRKLLLENAERDGFGIMTAFDLFRLVRNLRRLNWAPAHVKPLLYRHRRISVIPTHYTEIGKDLKIYPDAKAVVFILTGQELRVGHTIAVQREIDYFEGLVISIQVNSKEIELAQPGTKVGITTSIFEHIIKSDSLYLVDSDATT